MKKRKGEYFIGMTYSSSSNKKYSRRKRQRLRELYLRRTLIVSICVLVLAGLGAATYFFIIPSVSHLFAASSTSSVTIDEAPAKATEETTKPQVIPVTQAPTEAPTEPPTEEPDKPASVDTYVTPVIADDGKDGTLFSSTLYLYKGKGFNLFGNNLFWQTELRYAVNQHTACSMQSFVNRYIVAFFGKVACAG